MPEKDKQAAGPIGSDAGSGQQPSLADVLAAIGGIGKRLEGVEADLVKLSNNDGKLMGRIEGLENGGVGAVGAGGTDALLAQRVESLVKEVQELRDSPAQQPRTRDGIKKQWETNMKRSSDREKQLGTRMMWYPEPDPARRQAEGRTELCRVARGPNDLEELAALGYLPSLQEAAVALFEKTKEAKPPRYANVKAAMIALHAEEQRMARAQVASQAAPPMQVVVQASAIQAAQAAAQPAA